MEDNTLLSLRIVEQYNYAESKKEIDKMMLKFEMARYKYSELPQPTITPNYEVKYEMFTNNITDKVGNDVATKLDKFKEISAFYDKLSNIINTMTYTEKIYFIDSYFRKKSESFICEKLTMSSSSLSRVKVSCIIKVALAFDKAVEK